METMIETIRLGKRFGPIHAVDDLSFAVGKGEVLGFLGPNGAGKSTTMRILTGFIRPDAGTARVAGHDVVRASRAAREVIGYLPETAPAYGEMTVRSFLRFMGNMRGLSGAALEKALDGVAEKCRLDGGVQQQPFETLSKGYKRRTTLAQALLHDPPVLILDEPTDGLDPNQKHDVRRLIAAMAEEKCIVLSTHILEEVDAVCTRAVVIDRGRLVADDTPDGLRRRDPDHGAVTIRFTGDVPGEAVGVLSGLPGVHTVVVNDGGIWVQPESGAVVAAAVAERARDQGWQISELHVQQGQLDEVFRGLTAQGGTRR